MDQNKHDYLVQLDRIVERQIKVYSDLLDRVIIILKEDGHSILADRVNQLKVLYGLGEFAHHLHVRERKAKVYITVDDAKYLIVKFLKSHLTKKFRYGDIRESIDGFMTESCWIKARRELIKDKMINYSGSNKNQVYWIE